MYLFVLLLIFKSTDRGNLSPWTLEKFCRNLFSFKKFDLNVQILMAITQMDLGLKVAWVIIYDADDAWSTTVH